MCKVSKLYFPSPFLKALLEQTLHQTRAYTEKEENRRRGGQRTARKGSEGKSQKAGARQGQNRTEPACGPKLSTGGLG